MRRPHRNIEVFDISLMAVVTKAMGAFLVLMLLLMPYYSSGPIGQQAAADLAKKLAEVTENIKATMEKVAKASPEDLRKLLEEAIRRLEEARILLDQVKRANDALNAQVKRLQDENDVLKPQVAQLRQENEQQRAQIAQKNQEIDDLKKQVEDLKKQLDDAELELRGVELTGQVLNWDCLDVAIDIGIRNDSEITRTLKDKRRVPAPLDTYFTLGTGDLNVNQQMVAAVPARAAAQPGQSVRFNSAFYRYMADPGTYYVFVTKKSVNPLPPAARRFAEVDERPLVKTANDCSVLVSLQSRKPKAGIFAEYPDMMKIPRDAYAIVVREIVIAQDNTVTVVPQPTAAAQTLLARELEAAKKDATQPPPPAPTDASPDADEQRRRAREEMVRQERLRRQNQNQDATPGNQP